MTSDLLVSEASPLPLVLQVLKTRESIFVLMGAEVGGILTRADLNKPPVRVYLFGIVSLLEMHLGYWLQRGFPDNSWKEKLSAKRLEAAVQLQHERAKRKQEVDAIECLQFCDKRDLVVSDAKLRTTLKLPERNPAIAFLKAVEDLRNLLAHSQADIVIGSSWTEILSLVDRIEEVLHASDAAVEASARQSSGGGTTS